jgi:hypothetical protein
VSRTIIVTLPDDVTAEDMNALHQQVNAIALRGGREGDARQASGVEAVATALGRAERSRSYQLDVDDLNLVLSKLEGNFLSHDCERRLNEAMFKLRRARDTMDLWRPTAAEQERGTR